MHRYFVRLPEMRSNSHRASILGWRAAVVLAAIFIACSPAPATTQPASEQPVQPTEKPSQATSPVAPSQESSEGQIIFHSDPNGGSDFYLTLSPALRSGASAGVNADSSGLVRLTENANTEPFPTVSPDGQWIAFSTKDTRDIFVLNLAEALQDPGGARPINLTQSASREAEPAWSPDSRRLAFVSYDDGLIYVVDLPEAGRTATPPVPQALAQGFEPDWSPDGKRIAFFSDRDGNAEIYVVPAPGPQAQVNADGSEQTRLTNDPAADYTPRWSPDGRQILFVSERDGNAEIYEMPAPGPQAQVNADGSGQMNVSNDRAHDEFAFWSPDSTRILYVSYQDGADPFSIGEGNAEIFVVNADGTGKTNLTDNDVWNGDPGWSPDGKRIVFTRREGPDRQGHIYVMNADGSDPIWLLGEPGAWNDCCAVWQP